MKIILLLLLFVFSCHQPSTKQQLVNEIRNKVATQLKNEKKLFPIGTGGQMMDQIEMLALSFDYYGEIGIEEGRELLLGAINEFVATVNADERIQPYLKKFPFEPKNIEIRIFLRNSTPGKLCVLSAIDDVLEYDIRDPKTDRLKSVYDETFQEATRKMAQNLCEGF